MDISVNQRFHFSYAEPVPMAVLHLLVIPVSGPTQTVNDWHIEMDGFENAARYIDAVGNLALSVTQAGPLDEIEIAISGSVQTVPGSGVIGQLADDPVPGLFKRITPSTRSPVSVWGKYRTTSLDGAGRLEVLHGLMARINEMVGSEEAEDDAEPAGPEDYAQAFVGAARALNIPARGIRGYYAQSGQSGMPHAWAEAWDPGLGWIAFDPFINACPGEKHLRVSAGLDLSGWPVVRLSPEPDKATSVQLGGAQNSLAQGSSQQQNQS